MRTLKWTLIIVVILAILATALYLRRDYVARELANSALSDTDIAVAELSVRSLSVSRIELSTLVLVSETGSRIVIRGLSVPLGLSDVGTNEIFAESVEVEFGRDRAAGRPLSDSIGRILALPSELADITIGIDTITLPDLPVVRNALWSAAGNDQRARVEFDGHEIEVTVDGEADGGYGISLRADGGAAGAELAVSATTDGIEMRGPVHLAPGDWLDSLRSLSLLPDGIESIETQLTGPISIALDDGRSGDISIDASLAPVDGAVIDYATAEGSVVRFDMSAVTALDLHFSYPDMTWTAASNRIDGLVTIDGGAFPLLLNDLECRSGIRCTMYATIYGENLSWADYAVDTASVASPIMLQAGDQTRVGIPPDASFFLTGIRVADVTIASAQVLAFSGTEVIVEEDWRGSAQDIRLGITALEVADELSTSGELGITGLSIAGSGNIVDADIALAPGATAAWGGLEILLPGLSGTVTRRDDELRTSLSVRDRAIEAGIDLTRNFASGAGSISIRDARISFDSARLSRHVRRWPFVWDVVAGVLTANASLDWETTDSGILYTGSVAADLQKLSGMYEDYAFVGLTTALRGAVDSADGIALEPASISVALIDVGLPVENLTADYSLDVESRRLSVENLAMDAMGGRITARPFSYSAESDDNEIIFDAQSIQLALIADLADFEALEMTGSISGEVPVRFESDSIGVDSGQLVSDDPGGVIRYSSGLTEQTAAEGNLAIVMRALSNFEFDRLSTTVDYGDDGELVLTTRLSGINPDTDPNQPIILNLNVDTNIPQMLRSLRAIRTIEDILEERTAE